MTDPLIRCAWALAFGVCDEIGRTFVRELERLRVERAKPKKKKKKSKK